MNKINENKIALLMDNNAYVGREYLSNLFDFGVDVITVGNFNEVDLQEDDRCGNIWRPLKQEILEKNFNFFKFSDLNSDELIQFLRQKKYQYGIQGGTGIIKQDLIDCFLLGILNFHPGDLPEYRGCSAPEWQIYENKDIICTCHLIDKRIDAGKILAKKLLNVDLHSYNSFRASIYPEIALFVNEIVSAIEENLSFIERSYKQDESKAIYREYIGAEKIFEIDKKLKSIRYDINS